VPPLPPGFPAEPFDPTVPFVPVSVETTAYAIELHEKEHTLTRMMSRAALNPIIQKDRGKATKLLAECMVISCGG
jgi:hypothetical protein